MFEKYMSPEQLETIRQHGEQLRTHVDLRPKHAHDDGVVYGSKAVGEPPLMLALSAFFAIKDAVSAAAGHKVQVQLDSPATPERILLACERAKRAGG